MRLEAVNIVGAVSWIVNKGYDREYRIKDGHLFDLALNCPLDPRGIHVGTALRLESRPNAGDASVVYAILDQKTLGKGLLINIFDEICDRGLAERLVEILRHCRLHQQVPMQWSRGHRYFQNGPDFRGNRRSTGGEAVEFNERKKASHSATHRIAKLALSDSPTF